MYASRNQDWWYPWRRLREMEQEMGRLFGQLNSPPASAFPPVNVYTHAEGAVVTAEVPGVDPKSLDVTVHDQALVLKGDRGRDEAADGGEGKWHRRERMAGQFARSIELPFAVEADTVEANCRDGVLEVRLQRRESDKPRKISVQG